MAAPAHAHDTLVGTDPAADSTLERSPAQLALTFSADISTEQGASVVEVIDGSGADLAGDPVATDNVLLVPLEGEATGAVTVRWKVVSSDGHPISGEYAFTVTPASTPTESAAPSPSASEPLETTTPEPAETAVPGDEDSTFSSAWPWVIGGILVVGALGAVVFLLVTRARQKAELAKARATTAGGGTEPPVDR